MHVWSAQFPPWELSFSILDGIYGIKETLTLQERVHRIGSISYLNVDDVSRLPASKLLDYHDALGDRMETVVCKIDHDTRTSKVQVYPVTRLILELAAGLEYVKML